MVPETVEDALMAIPVATFGGKAAYGGMPTLWPVPMPLTISATLVSPL